MLSIVIVIQKPDVFVFVIFVERDGEAVGDVENATLFQAAEKKADDAFDISDFTRAIEVIDDAEQHQRMYHHLFDLGRGRSQGDLRIYFHRFYGRHGDN